MRAIVRLLGSSIYSTLQLLRCPGLSGSKSSCPDKSGQSGFEVYPDIIGTPFSLHPDTIVAYGNK